MTDVLTLPGVARSASGSVAQYKDDALRSSGSERLLGDDSQQKPFRRILTKNRQYLETGYMHVDEAVLQYMAKLEEHRRRWVVRRSPTASIGVAFVDVQCHNSRTLTLRSRCENEGRYQEARVAAKRLADLRTAQVCLGSKGWSLPAQRVGPEPRCRASSFPSEGSHPAAAGCGIG